MKFDKQQALTWPAMITLFLFALVPLITMLITSFQSDAGGGFTLENYKEFFSSSILSQADRQDDRHESYGHHRQPRYRLSPRLYHGKKTEGTQKCYSDTRYHTVFYKSAGACVQLAHFSSGRGILNNFLNIFGLYEDGMGLLYTQGAVIIGLTHAFFPYMVVTIYMALERMDDSLLEASRSLGASRFTTFRRVVFPLSLPGVLSGVMIVFVPTLGTFVEPRILTFTKYENNPVLTSEARDFRDPKVFWYESTKRWIMVLAVGQEMQIFSSPNLKDWTFESQFR